MNDHSPHQIRKEQGFLDDYLQFLLATASGLASHPFHEQVSQTGASVAEWRVMACLSNMDGQTITELARLAQMEQSRLTRVIERMENRGYVTRERRTDDRRKVYVWLTEQGGQIAADLVQQAKIQEAQFLKDHLTPTEALRLKALLSKLIESASKETIAAIRRG